MPTMAVLPSPASAYGFALLEGNNSVVADQLRSLLDELCRRLRGDAHGHARPDAQRVLDDARQGAASASGQAPTSPYASGVQGRATSQRRLS
jgi:hypothetical protein